MYQIKFFCIYFVLSLFLSGCQAKGENDEAAVSSNVFIALACVGENPDSNIEAATFLEDEDKGSYCVDKRSEKIYFSENYLKLKMLKNETSKIKLGCIQPEKHSEFYKKNNGKKALLIANGRVLLMAIALDSHKKENCGEINFSGYEKSANLCFAYQNALGKPEADCTNACAESDSKVCIED
jgi:hypothetical protein